jgi:hypothetical protein
MIFPVTFLHIVQDLWITVHEKLNERHKPYVVTNWLCIGATEFLEEKFYFCALIK